MQNWEVLQKKISEMNEDDFINLVKNISCVSIGELLNITPVCSGGGCLRCKKRLFEDEYQPLKQEKWVVHRALRTKNVEVYIGCDKGNKTNANKFVKYPIRCNSGDILNTSVTYNKNKAFRYEFEDAVLLRDKLNEERVGKQYLWVISKVEE